MENITELYEGVNVKIKGTEYIVPGLSLGQVEQFADKLQNLVDNGDALSKEMIQTVAEVSHAALSRNYPEMSLDMVKEMLDLRNMKEVLDAVMGSSGFINVQKSNGGNCADGATLKRA